MRGFDVIGTMKKVLRHDNSLSVESTFTLIFQSSLMNYTYETSIRNLILRILTVILLQQNTLKSTIKEKVHIY